MKRWFGALALTGAVGFAGGVWWGRAGTTGADRAAFDEAVPTGADRAGSASARSGSSPPEAGAGARTVRPVRVSGSPAPPEEPPLDPPLSEAEATALVAQGDASMDAGDLAAATAAFQQVVDGGPDARLAPYALFKLAWCHRNAGLDAEAVADLDLLLQWGRAGDIAGQDVLLAEATKTRAQFVDEPSPE